MNGIRSLLLLTFIMADIRGVVVAQTTTADGSLPGGVNNDQRAVALSDPFVKKNMDALKSVRLDPVILLRLAQQVDEAQKKNKSTSGGSELALTDASGAKLSAKGQVLAAYLFAKQENLKGSQIVAQMKKGASLASAAELVLSNKLEEKNTQAKNASSVATAKIPELLKEKATTIQ